MADHPVMLPECEMKFQQIDKHLETSPANRDAIVKHEQQIIGLFGKAKENKESIEGIYKKIDEGNKETQKNILTGFLAVIVSVVLAILWTGRYVEKVERLDKLHPVKMEIAQNGGDGRS